MTNAFAQQWLSGMISVSLQFAVFVAIVAAVLSLWRLLPPRVRYVVWLMVLVRLALPAGMTSPLGTLPSSLTPTPMWGTPVLGVPPASEPSQMAAPTLEVARRTLLSGATVSIAEIFLATWTLGVIGLAAIHLARAARRRRRIAEGRSGAPDELSEQIERLGTELGLRRTADVWVVHDDAICGPSIQGALRPRILLPRSLVHSWRPEELKPVLLHELIHLKRWDPVARVLGNTLRIVYFFHPLVWWVTQRLNEERERACDDAVVRHLGEKRGYMRGLLRLVEEGSARFALELSMATTRRPLAKRLKRMLRPDYDPSSRTRIFELSALALMIGLGLTLSTEARVQPETQAAQSPTIQSRVLYRQAFFAESVDQLDRASAARIGGDFTIGGRTTRLNPDASRLAHEDPALWDRLKALGRLTAMIIIDRQGVVRRVVFARNVDEELRRPFEQALLEARFDPTTHYDRGPVIVEAEVQYAIDPTPLRVSPYDEGQELVGDEVADIVGLVAGSDAQETVPVRQGILQYAPILGKGVPPAVDAPDEERVFSFLLSVDVLGFVESATLVWDSGAGPHADPEPTPLSEQLREYAEGFRFEPLTLNDFPARGTLMLDLRVSSRGVEVATRGGNEENVQRRIEELYRLADGRNLDLRPPPHPPERMILYRTHNPMQARVIPSGPDRAQILWDDGRVKYRSSCFGCDDLRTLLERFMVRRGGARFDDEALNVRIVTDVLMREGASQDELLADLPGELNEHFDLDLSFRRTTETSRSLVLRGHIGTVPRDDDEDGRRVLHVYTDRKNDDGSGSGGGPFTDTAALVQLLSLQLAMPVLEQTTIDDAEPFYIRMHDSAYETAQLDLLIRNIESQTSLGISVEERSGEVVIVSQN